MSTSLEAKRLLKALYQADKIMKAQAWLKDKPTPSADEMLTRARQERRQQKKLNAEPFSRYKELQRLKQASDETKAIYQRKYDLIYSMTHDEELSRFMGLREVYRSKQ